MDPKTSNSKISQIWKNAIVEISKISLNILKFVPEEFGANWRPGTHFLKFLLFELKLIVFSIFLKFSNNKGQNLSLGQSLPLIHWILWPNFHGPRLIPLGVMAKSCFSCFRLYWNDHTWFIFIYFQTKRFPSKLLSLKWCPEARGSSHVKKFEFWNFHLLGAVTPLFNWHWQCHINQYVFLSNVVF